VRTLAAALFAAGLVCAADLARSADAGERVRTLLEQQCASCHRFSGEPASKFQIRGPDLMWAGQKYQREWLVGWLEGKEPSPYPKRYRWDQAGEATPHPKLSAADARAVADHFERELRDARVREGAYDPSRLSKTEARFGAALFREYSCIGCHQVMEDGKPVGGPISTHFFDAGRRYDPDWVWAFNLNPPAFTPHSGEYVADLTERKVGWITGYIMTLGDDDFAYARPWEAAPFASADPERGREVYTAYCAQCHGLGGEGDGPGAAGLEPRPAAHARMAIDALPPDYLYDVVFYGGKAVGKSPSMPDWGATLSTQQLADVLAYMRATFRGAPAAEAATPAVCPQPRTTQSAPADLLAARNPLERTAAHVAAGEKLYRESAVPMPCQMCHGEKGDGLGPMAPGFTPRPRNFTCAETMRAIPDGQLFWIIRNGSPGTGMLAYAPLTDEQIWQIVFFLRSLAP
jgi:mono/diheme cytochrome c family protein